MVWMHEMVYPRLMRAFFATTEVDNNNFTLRATLKVTKILIEQLLVDLLGAPIDSERLYADWLEVKGHRKKKIQRKFGGQEGRF